MHDRAPSYLPGPPPSDNNPHPSKSKFNLFNKRNKKIAPDNEETSGSIYEPTLRAWLQSDEHFNKYGTIKGHSIQPAIRNSAAHLFTPDEEEEEEEEEEHEYAVPKPVMPAIPTKYKTKEQHGNIKNRVKNDLPRSKTTMCISRSRQNQSFNKNMPPSVPAPYRSKSANDVKISFARKDTSLNPYDPEKFSPIDKLILESMTVPQLELVFNLVGCPYDEGASQRINFENLWHHHQLVRKLVAKRESPEEKAKVETLVKKIENKKPPPPPKPSSSSSPPSSSSPSPSSSSEKAHQLPKSVSENNVVSKEKKYEQIVEKPMTLVQEDQCNEPTPPVLGKEVNSNSNSKRPLGRAMSDLVISSCTPE
eukprot:Awhi_evm1s2798